MVSTAEIAGFSAEVAYERLPEDVREAAKRRILDAVGASLRDGDAAQSEAIRRTVAGTSDTCRLWGSTANASAADAAMANAAAIESANSPVFLSPKLSTPSGAIAAVLAAAERRDTPGEETLAALAAALEIQGELAWNAPLDEFHPATHGTVAATAGVGRAIGLDTEELAHAIGMAASRMALELEDARYTPLASGFGASNAVRSCLLADHGVESPDSLAAPNGWHDIVGPFDLDLDPGCERVRDAAVLPYDAHPYGQPTIEAAIELAGETPIDPADIETVLVETFGNATPVLDPERIAAALVDRELFVHRSGRVDLEPIVENVEIVATDEFTDQMDDGTFPSRLVVETRGETDYEAIADRFDGHPTVAASWGTVEEKFRALSDGVYDRTRRDAIVETVRSFEAETATELARLLD